MGLPASASHHGVPANMRSILVIDDEQSIRKTLAGVLEDEGYRVIVAEDGEQGLHLIQSESPALVFLDIWMRGADGIEVLGRIRAEFPALPVVMISGHATIATAIKATQLGATDFLEKPLDLNRVLEVARKALFPQSTLGVVGATPDTQGQLAIGIAHNPCDIQPVVFADQKLRGAAVKQHTLAHSALLYGLGLHSGKKSGLILEPLPPNSGIHFASVSDPSIVPAHVDFVLSTGLATTVRQGGTQASTIEHLMSALHAYGIANLLIKCNGEVPAMDGSALPFCKLIEEIGVVEQAGSDWFEIAVPETLRVEGKGGEFIQIDPADAFSVEYTLKYPAPLGTQHFVFTKSDVDAYKREIAPARTFAFVKDIEAMQKRGLGLGGRLDNFVLVGENGIVNAELRFKQEAVRHKILDAIGDLYLLGRPLRGRVTACMTGHSDNIELLRRIRELLRSAAA